jgi:hypothetical protein
MADYNIGKGVYIWQPNTIAGGNPDGIAARLKMSGTTCAAIKICDGFRVLPGLEPLFQSLRNNKIHVAAWGYSYLNRAPLQEAHVVAEAIHHYNPDFYLIDVEAEVEGNYAGARMFMNELRPATAGMPLGLNSFWNISLHPTFPWADFLKKCDFVCPQVYWRGVDPIGKLRQSQQEFEHMSGVPDVPMPIVAGDMFVDIGTEPTPQQVTEFLAAADADPFIHGVFMWAADDTQTTPELWQAYSAYQWKQGGAPLPAQPLGWAKVKAGGGIWVRSAPLGAKVGSLARAELAPLWRITDTKWAAITKAGDRWIYVGDAKVTEVILDSSIGGQAPSSPGIYRASVVAKNGLNVRKKAKGAILRAIPYGTQVQVYEEKNGWGRIHASQDEWVSTDYLSKLA